MSCSYRKHTITYDSGWGCTETKVIYQIYYNSTDTQSFKYENGDIIELYGTDDFIYCIQAILNGDEVNHHLYSVKSEVIGWADLPEKVRP